MYQQFLCQKEPATQSLTHVQEILTHQELNAVAKSSRRSKAKY